MGIQCPEANVMRPRVKDLYFLFFSLSIGLLAAVGAIFFRTLIEIFQHYLWPSGTTFIDQVTNSPWWLRVLIPTVAGLIVGPLITFLVPEAKGPGVPVVIEAVTTWQSTLRHRVTALKALVTSFLIASGASVGREGPIVQIGASIGSSLAQLFRLDPALRRTCLACGAAAGIAATFNAPIAGTLFAVEIILLDIEIGHISHIIISSVIASVFARIFWGEFPTFEVSSFQLISHWELVAYLLLGVLAGLVAIVFVRLIYTTDSIFSRLRIPEWTKPTIGGLFLGLIGLKVPYVMGVGYETVNLALTSSLLLEAAIVILAAKILATSLCLGSGMSGGIFAPSLVLGATLGTIVGLIIAQIFPELTLIPSDYALVGMGAVVAGTTLAPITAILTVFELTYTYQIILPLMVACIASATVVRVLFGYSAYEMKLLKKGITIVRGHDIGILRTMLVKDFMSREFERLEDSMSFSKIMDQVIESSYPHFVVLNRTEELVGV
ncbi:MAG: chloride channel protein, partial [Deltaproteobacteria bacterium]|nr:chloride channel protein [Deltaproteobacteria bacterium]